MIFLLILGFPILLIGIYLTILCFSFLKNSFHVEGNADEKINLLVKIPLINKNINFAFSGVLGFIFINFGFFIINTYLWSTDHFSISDSVCERNCFLNPLFLDSFYYTVTTGTTLGYGEIVPSSSLVRLLSTLQQLMNIIEVGLVIYGFGKGGGWLIGRSGGGGPGSGPIRPKDLNNFDKHLFDKIEKLSKDTEKNLSNKINRINSSLDDFFEYKYYRRRRKIHPYLRKVVLSELREMRNNEHITDEELLDQIIFLLLRL